MVEFIEERLLDCVAYGSEFGREFNTRIVTLKSGHDRRNAQWSMPLGRYAVIYRALLPEDHALVRNAHMACMGSLIGFRLKDWTDFQVEDEIIGTADGSLAQQIQLTKKYQFGATTVTRTIGKPVDDIILTAAEIPIAHVLDTTTGLVLFSADAGAIIRWTGEFDVPVRFESDRLDFEPDAPASPASGGYLLSSDVRLVEIRLPSASSSSSS